ncbi:hypothetical protein [Methylobacterium sp. WSM2598]|uniref:hypothetical protein n=1 Tax=Methylobacterium sp. WSM2598 TaxID=398261 RepID=UPI001F3F45C7|nr:hypothetical protein [Methylobacterium sp. WSM2598]
MSKKEDGRVDFVRHHAFVPRFERLGTQWFLIVNPTYYFTTNGFIPHSHPAALLAGKKRMDNSASLRGQIVMWHRFLTAADKAAERAGNGLFDEPVCAEPRLRFGQPPAVQLRTRVPEDVWGTPKKRAAEASEQSQGLLV